MLIGHEALAKDFERLIAENVLGHSYIFFGSSRIGKRLFATALARRLEQGEFSESGERKHPLSDMMLLDSQGASIGIDAIRDLKQFLFQTPFVSPRRTAIVNDAQLLTDEAQNALLKLAEEPPASALLLLVMDEPDRLRPALRSRFGQVHFSPLSAEQMDVWFTENGVEGKELSELARRAKGHPGLAWAMLHDERMKLRLASARDFLNSPPETRKDLVKELVAEEEFDLGEFLEALMIEAADRKDPRFWHAVLDLQRENAATNLNPKLQLMALAKILV